MPHVPRNASRGGSPARPRKAPAPSPIAPLASQGLQGPYASGMDELPLEPGPINADKPEVARNPVVRKRRSARQPMLDAVSMTKWDVLPDDIARSMGLL